MDSVFIEGLECHVLIGVYDYERRAPQKLVFDLELEVDNRKSATSDDLHDTVDYALVADMVARICDGAQFQLVEALAERIAAHLLAQFPVARVALRVTKPGAVPAARGVGVRIERTRT